MATSETPVEPTSQFAALTPRPRRLLLIGEVDPGNDRAVREIQAQFPARAAAAAGITAVESFIGNGFFAMMLEVDAEDVQEVLGSYFNHPAIREFHAQLESVTNGFPPGDRQFGVADEFHEEAETVQETGTSPVTTGDLPIAASMFRWHMGDRPDLGDVPQKRLDRHPS